MTARDEDEAVETFHCATCDGPEVKDEGDHCPDGCARDFDDKWAGASCPDCGEPVDLSGRTCGAAECGGKRLPSGGDHA